MARKTHDDLFEGSTMTFGEHLEELRANLFRAVFGILAGCVVGFFIANSVVRFFQLPLERAMERFYIDKALSDYGQKYGDVPVEVRRVIVDEGLLPESLQFEIGSIARTLAQFEPEVFGGVNVSPFSFTSGDFIAGEVGAADLAKQLVEAGQSERATAARRIWLTLSTDQQTAVKELAGSSGALSAAEVAQLANILNSLAGDEKLHEAEELAGLTGPDADATIASNSLIGRLLGTGKGEGDTVADLRKQLAASEKLAEPAETSRRLNKLLIARVFPDSLRKARPSLLTLTTWKPVKVRFQVLNAQESFMIWLKAALVTGLVIASPYVFYQVWVFVAAGLYPHEKHYVFLYLPISILLFLGGASLAFLFVFDPVLDFLFTFNKGMNADFDPRIGEWLGFVLILPVGFGLGFQLPLVMVFINRIGLVSIDTYIQQWRIAVLIICVVAMVLTPAEPISMMMMAVPLCLLYLAGILMCRYMPKGRNPFDEAYEP
jgi:sec-independent protein translocase protein TatC